MEFRVQEVLLVASHYDTFVLEEDGQLTELLLEEYRHLALSLRFTPHISPTTSATEALHLIESEARNFQMVVASPRLPDMNVGEFARRVKELRPDISFCVLAAHAWNLPELDNLRDSGNVDFLFLWQGHVKALVAMIKQVEDHRNAEKDVLGGGVQVIILVEDEVRYYSAYLPHIYTEVTRQTGRLMAEGLNLSHRLLRIRARPKILLAQNYEEAWDLFEKYRDNVLGLITDVRFPVGGQLVDNAGLDLARKVREQVPDLALLVQSTNKVHKEVCNELGAMFLHKRSSHMLDELAHFIIDHFGFGDFVFKDSNGNEVARARDLREMIRALHEVPEESIRHHAMRNHFSSWLKARTEFELASLVRPRQVDDFTSIQEMRQFLIVSITDYLRQIQRQVIIDYKTETFDEYVAFAKIGSGSLGGKGRGLAFVQKLLTKEWHDRPDVDIDVPQTVAVASDIFEEFLAENGMRRLPREVDALTDEEIHRRFRSGRFNHERRTELAGFLEELNEPLAIRSSSILEDSLYQPFAGVYATVMLPNNHPSLDVRLAQVLEAIKLVYASTFLKAARDYLVGTPHRIEEERMAVLLQRLVGSQHGDLFYPTLSGLASSYNFYPFGEMSPEDGVAQVALGLGKSVVEGFEAFRFCPRYPDVLPQFSSVKDTLRTAQRRFYALDMLRNDIISTMPPDSNLPHIDVGEAVKHGGADMLLSSYIRDDDAIVLGKDPRGTPIVTFAPLLKGHSYPLPEILQLVLQMAHAAMECPVEIEFALQAGEGGVGRPVLNLLQVRPLMVEQISGDVDVDIGESKNTIVYSEDALGHGRRMSVADLVIVSPKRIDRSSTRQVATAVERVNRIIAEEGREYILIGPGRWGSQDPWLGMPVKWSQISAARAIVETDFPDLEVEPSYGSHFFQNITCFGIAYMTVHDSRGLGHVNWDWLDQQPSTSEELDGVVRHLRLDNPVHVLVDGKARKGVVRSE
jgi:CheY-like chemotaxis protein